MNFTEKTDAAAAEMDAHKAARASTWRIFKILPNASVVM